MLSEIRDFAWSVLNQWLVLLTGGIMTVLLTIIQWYREKSYSWRFSKWVLLLFLTVAIFRAWSEKNQALIALQKELTRERDVRKPKLSGRIEQVTHGSGERGERVLFVSMSIANSGADSVARGFGLTIVPDLGQLRPTLIPVDGFTLRDGNKPLMKFTNADAVYEKAATPIKAGDVKVGVLLYVLDKAVSYGASGKIVISFDDYLGNHYEADAFYDAARKDPLQYIPGSGGKPAK